jgi:hypothetical protein
VREEEKRKNEVFINHIANHLKKGEKVICKICGKTVEEIFKEKEFRQVCVCGHSIDEHVPDMECMVWQCSCESYEEKDKKFFCGKCKAEVKWGDNFCKCGEKQLWALFG